MWLQFEHKWTDKLSHYRKNTCSCYNTSRGIGREVLAHTQKFWFVENPSKIAENLGKNGGQPCLILKNGTQHFQKNT